MDVREEGIIPYTPPYCVPRGAVRPMSNQKIKTMANLKAKVDAIRQEKGIGRRGGNLCQIIILDAEDVKDLGPKIDKTSERTGNPYSYHYFDSTFYFCARNEQGVTLPAAVGQTLEITLDPAAGRLNFNLYL